MTNKVFPKPAAPVTNRRRFTDEFRREAVQMMLGGHSATSVAQRLGISSPTLLSRWKQQLRPGGLVASLLDVRVRELEAELLRVQRERVILKKRWPFSTGRSDGSVRGGRVDHW